ncbi:MAG: hypothetical protein ACREA0_16735 [bacterium]
MLNLREEDERGDAYALSRLKGGVDGEDYFRMMGYLAIFVGALDRVKLGSFPSFCQETLP